MKSVYSPAFWGMGDVVFQEAFCALLRGPSKIVAVSQETRH